MLIRLDLRDFKCFGNLQLPFAPLTLLSGFNASGKSSVLQALVLLHQTMREHEWSTRLMLNGSIIHMGTLADVVDKVNGRSEFEIGIVDDNLECSWVFAGERSDMSMRVDTVTVAGAHRTQPNDLQYLIPHDMHQRTLSLTNRIRRLTYLTAERVGPREVYDLLDRQVATVVGSNGEHALSLLHWGSDERVLPELLSPTAPSTRLRQVEAHMNTFFPGFAMNLQRIPQTNTLTLGVRTSTDTDFHRPVHVGFGLTQVLPIVIAGLSAVKKDILVIENPEVHLHPAGQALMGQFLGDLARAGVQIIVETHSDHLLNGIRRSVKAGRLEPEKVALHFFRPRREGMAQVISPQLDYSGNVDHWPEGFFDQFDKDANYFANWGD